MRRLGFLFSLGHPEDMWLYMNHWSHLCSEAVVRTKPNEVVVLELSRQTERWFIRRNWLTLDGGWPVPRPAGSKAGDPAKPMEQWWFESRSLRAGKRWCFSASPMAGSKPTSALAVRQEKLPLTHGGSVFLFYLGLHLTAWGPLTLGRAICFPQFIDLNVTVIQRCPNKSTQNNVWPNIWAPGGPLKLTHKGKHTEYIKVACDDKAFIRGGPVVLTHLLQAVRKEGVDSFIQSLAIIIHIMN